MKKTFETIYCAKCGVVETGEGKYRFSFRIDSAIRGEKEARRFVFRAVPKDISATQYGFWLDANRLVAKMLVGDRALDTYLPQDYLDLANSFLVESFSRLSASSRWFREEYVTDRLCSGFFAFLLMEMARAAGDMVSYVWVVNLSFEEEWDSLPFPKTVWMPWERSFS